MFAQPAEHKLWEQLGYRVKEVLNEELLELLETRDNKQMTSEKVTMEKEGKRSTSR